VCSEHAGHAVMRVIVGCALSVWRELGNSSTGAAGLESMHLLDAQDRGCTAEARGW